MTIFAILRKSFSVVLKIIYVKILFPLSLCTEDFLPGPGYIQTQITSEENHNSNLRQNFGI